MRKYCNWGIFINMPEKFLLKLVLRAKNKVQSAIQVNFLNLYKT